MPILKKAGRTALSMELHASGVIDHSDAEITLDMQNPGSLFAGFGGNFRLQNPAADPKVIDYCLENLRVAYGRVEFPWRLWQPEEESDPIAVAQNGGLNKRVEESFLMAKRLKAMGMPVILSCWFPPAWAIDGGPASYARQGGVIAYRLDSRKRRRFINPWQIICCMPNGIMVLSSPCSRSMNRIWVLMSSTLRRSMQISLRSSVLIWQG